MGAGELNAHRAVQQFAPGEYDPGTVPMIGWDYHTIGEGVLNEYVLSQPVAANAYIAITLAWDRDVTHTGGSTYHYGDTFFPYDSIDEVMDNLNLSLVTADGASVVSASVSAEMNLEHIFFKFQNAGQYKIVVSNAGGPVAAQNYGLAWWYGTAPPLVAGDYNGDNKVDASDYVTWRSDPGTYGGDPGGYDTWRGNFGASAGSGSSLASVPEPSSICLALLGIVVFSSKRRSA